MKRPFSRQAGGKSQSRALLGRRICLFCVPVEGNVFFVSVVPRDHAGPVRACMTMSSTCSPDSMTAFPRQGGGKRQRGHKLTEIVRIDFPLCRRTKKQKRQSPESSKKRDILGSDSNFVLRQGRCFCKAPLTFKNIRTRGKASINISKKT